MLRVADIMTREVFTVRASEPVEEVAWALATRSIRGAPVVGDGGELVGTLTKNALARHAHHAPGGTVPAILAEDLMAPEIAFLREDDAAVEAVRVLADGAHPQAVVVDLDGAVVGIVTPMDVLKALVHGDRFVDVDADAPEITARYLGGHP